MSYLQLASWNIEHLSGQPRAERRQSAFALADHIEMAGIDLLALQEVYVTNPDEEVRLSEGQPPIASRAQSSRRNSDLDIVCYLLEEHLDAPWKYLVLPNRSAGDRSQLCAVMWNSDRLSLEGSRALEVVHTEDGLSLWDRKPHLLSFKSSLNIWRRQDHGEWVRAPETRPFSFVPLHMKSNYGGVTKNRQVRLKEAATLCDAIDSIRGEVDPTLIMMGDTNILKNGEPALEEFVARGFVDLNNNDSATYWSKDYGEAPFDRTFVAEGRKEFKYSRQYVLRSSDLFQHDRFLSDHYMIKVSVKAYVDDRDPT